MGGRAAFGGIENHTFISTLQVNTVTPVLTAQALLPLLQKSPRAVIMQSQ